LALKVDAGDRNSTVATDGGSVQTSTLNLLHHQRMAKSSRRRTGHRPTTGWDWPALAAQARSAPSSATASRRATRSAGMNGASVGTLATNGQSGALAAAPSSPASTPASGPAKPAMLSATTGRP
jgi:hypothetical protein